MKGFFIVTVLAYFAFSLFQCVSASAPVNVVLGKDPRLVNLSHAVTEMYDAVKMADKLFEENRHNPARLVKLVEEIKELKAVLKGLQIEIRSEIAIHPFRSFYNRFALEALLIQTKYHGKLLINIAKEVLAERAGVTSFAVYETSEVMLVARELMEARYLDLLATMFEVDKLLVEAFQNGSTTVSAKTKTDIDQHFRKILTIDQLTRDELATDYYREVERIRLQDKELNLEMSMEFHVGIDMQNYLLDYVKNYEELFLKIVH